MTTSANGRATPHGKRVEDGSAPGCARRRPGAGRSPGSPVLTARLPVASSDSGVDRGRPHWPYRCGGSRGLARWLARGTAFPFHPPREAADTCVANCSTPADRRGRALDRPRARQFGKSWRSTAKSAGKWNNNSRESPILCRLFTRSPRITPAPGRLRDPEALHPHVRLPDERVRLGQDGRRARAPPTASTLTERPEDADVILFNTCSVREKAQERVFHDLGRVRALKARTRTSSSASAAASPARRARRSSSARLTSTSCSARRRCTGCRR